MYIIVDSLHRLFRVAIIFLVFAALGGPIVTYIDWRQQDLIHRLHAEGIERRAEIVGGRAQKSYGLVTYTLDLKWRLKSGAQYSGSVTASAGYARNFVSGDPFEGEWHFIARPAPIKYLEADPSSAILHLDPQNSERSLAERVELGAGISVAGIVGILLFYLIDYLRRKMRPEPAAEEMDEEPEAPAV